MSRALEPVVPEPLRAALEREPRGDGDDLAILVVVVRDDGWPHLAMVGPGELVASGDRSLRLALWPSSSAAALVEARRQVTLSAVVDGVSYSVRARARREPDLEPERGGRLAAFALEVEAAVADEAPYAVLESGVRFRLTDPAATVPRWQEVRAALRGRA